MAKAFSASSDEVVTWPMGTSNFCTDARDSPSLPRILETALPSAESTCSLLEACACSCARESPVWQLIAFSVRTYCEPRLATDPERVALLPARKQSSRARSEVRRSLGERPMKPSVSCTREEGITRRKGDCSRSTASACFNVPSNTGSPVVLAKSARTTVSFSVSFAARAGRKYRAAAINATRIPTAAGTTTRHRPLLGVAGMGALLDEGQDAETSAREETGADACPPDGGLDYCATATFSEPAATARPDSVSRFSRCRSARRSAACW